MPRTITPDEFWTRANRKPSGCWEWTRSLRGKGSHRYGQLFYHYKNYYAHRLAYLFAFGYLPSDKEIAHRCDNPKCVNPAHLYAATRLENARDTCTRGAFRDSIASRNRKERNAKCETENERTRQIFVLRAKKLTLHQIGELVGMSASGICRIVNGNRRRIWYTKKQFIKTDGII